MFTFLKWLFYLAVLAFIALVLFAYLGPLVGFDFAPQQVEIRQDVDLGTD